MVKKAAILHMNSAFYILEYYKQKYPISHSVDISILQRRVELSCRFIVTPSLRLSYSENHEELFLKKARVHIF